MRTALATAPTTCPADIDPVGDSPFRSGAAPRAAAALLGLMAVLLIAALTAPSALGAPPREVTVLDEAGVLDAETLSASLAEVEFRTDVDLVALTLDVTDHGADPGEDRALNDAVLGYARSERPEWISGDVWANDLVIIALDPENRFLGTYAGESVRLTEGQFEDVQEAMTDAAQDERWEDALTDGAEEYAGILARPWYLSTGFFVATILAGVGVLGAIGALVHRGATARRRIREGLDHLESVQDRGAETDRAVSRIPRDSHYGETVLAEAEEYRENARIAEELQDRLPPRRGPLWGLSPASYRLAQYFVDAARHADQADDGIIAAAALLSRTGDWREAWEEERQPLDDSLAKVEEMIALEPELEESGTAAELRAGAESVAATLEEVSAGYLGRRLGPDAALAELDRLTDDLSQAAGRHREAIIEHSAGDEEEAEVMRSAEAADAPAFTGALRSRRHHRYTEQYAQGWSISPIVWMSLWHGSAGTSLESHRNPSSSTTGTTGYSGGGFSGAGSSGRF